MHKYGLSKENNQVINDIIIKYPEITKVIIFGSRAKNTFTKTLDIDLAIYGKKVTNLTISKLQEDFELSCIPYFFDIININTMLSSKFKNEISTYGKMYLRN